MVGEEGMNLTLEQWAVALTAIVAVAGFGLSLHNWWQGRSSEAKGGSLSCLPVWPRDICTIRSRHFHKRARACCGDRGSGH